MPSSFMQCGLQDSADLTVFNLLDMMFFLTVPHWAVYTLVLLLHVCTLILIDIDIDTSQCIYTEFTRIFGIRIPNILRYAGSLADLAPHFSDEYASVLGDFYTSLPSLQLLNLIEDDDIDEGESRA